MSNMLARVRELLTEPTGYNPFPAEAPAREGNVVKLLKLPPLPPEPTPDYLDVTALFQQAGNETAMTITPETSLVTKLIEDMTTYKTSVSQQRTNILAEQEAANKEHEAQIARLNDEIKSRNTTHEDATADFNERIADADKALAATDAGLAALAPAKEATGFTPKTK